MAHAGAFRYGDGEDARKSKETLIYERNTFKKQYKLQRARADAYEEAYDTAKDYMFAMAIETVKSTGGAEGTKAAVWSMLEKYARTRRAYSRDTTGEKTHYAVVEREILGTKQNVEAHVTPGGDYYKPWKAGDSPTYFLHDLELTPANWTLGDDGVFKPIKKY
jgi:hypothetical protein